MRNIKLILKGKFDHIKRDNFEEILEHGLYFNSLLDKYIDKYRSSEVECECNEFNEDDEKSCNCLTNIDMLYRLQDESFFNDALKNSTSGNCIIIELGDYTLFLEAIE